MAFNIEYEPKEESDYVAIENKNIGCAEILAPPAEGIEQNHCLEENRFPDPDKIRTGKSKIFKDSPFQKISEEINEIHFNFGMVIRFWRRTSH